MLEIRRGIAARNYENTFFREFADNLSQMFDKYERDGILIGNSECVIENRLQIDALLITKKVVCIIDFKNFEGKINLPNTSNFIYGQWTNSTKEIIKGGSSINPYCQLKTQRKRFFDIFKNHIEPHLPQSNYFNPGHTVRVVCFQKPVELNGEIPPQDEVNFKIIHQGNYLEKLKDILDVTDKEVNLTNDSYSAFLDVFEADVFDVKEEYNEIFDFQPDFEDLDYNSLRQDQQTALKEVAEFLESDEEQVFILQGTSQSGKTHLIPFIKKLAFDSKISQVELLAPSSRIANNLVKSIDGIGSLYSFIYGGNQTSEHDDDESTENKGEGDSKVDIVPLKKCDNEENSIFIVDESQLISDNYHQSFDLRFGSGHLLKDFIKYSEIGNTPRKIIFIGDCYQISLGKANETPLSPSHLTEQYKLKLRAFQLDDNSNGSVVLKNALKCAESIKRNIFNSLQFNFNKNFTAIEKNDVSPLIKKYLNSNEDFKFLCYTNEEARKVNLWVKRSIIGNGEDLAVGDLIVLNNNINVEEYDNPFAKPQRVYNGQFFTIESTEGSSVEKVELKGGTSIELIFRKLKAKLLNSNKVVSLYCLENYRNSLKAELSNNETIAIKVLLNRQLKNELQTKPFANSTIYKVLVQSEGFKGINKEIGLLNEQLSKGEKVKTKLEAIERELRILIRNAERKHKLSIEKELLKDVNSTFYKLKNLALLRFGWAFNVHKAMSYKWQSVIFNVDWSGGISNAAYFKWLYTGLTRSLDKIKLINYQCIEPSMDITFKDISDAKSNPKEYYHLVTNDDDLSNFDEEILRKYNVQNADNKNLVIQLYKIVATRLTGSEFTIHSIEHPNYQQVYCLKNDDNETKIRFYYDGKLRIKFPSIQSGSNNEINEQALNLLNTFSPLNDFNFISDSWRKDFYTELNIKLKVYNLFIQNVLQNSYKDIVFIYNDDELQLEVEFNFNADGFFSSIVANFYSEESNWESFKSIF